MPADPCGCGYHPDPRHPDPYDMAFWVKGSIKGMIEGKVSRAGRRNTIRAGIVKSRRQKRKRE